MATDNTKESSWQIDTTNTSVYYENTGRTVTKIDNNTTWRYFYYNSNALSSTQISGRYTIPTGNIIEFEVTSVTGSIVIDVLDNLNNHYDGAILTATGIYKVVLDGTDIKIHKDNRTTPITTKTMNGSNVRFGFVMNAYNESITYKDFIIYSI